MMGSSPVPIWQLLRNAAVAGQAVRGTAAVR